jgi:hypothetical protein
MCELIEDENRAFRSQNATLKRGQHSKYLPLTKGRLGTKKGKTWLKY